MALSTDRAIVIRLSDYSETSQVVSLFTREAGLVRLLAKGIRRGTKTRFAAGLDLLELGDLGFHAPRGDAGLGTLANWSQTDTFPGLRRNLTATYAGLYAAELLNGLTGEYDPHTTVFDAFEEMLRSLTEASGPDTEPESRVETFARAVVRFQAALLRGIGLAPNLRQCGVCGKSRTGEGSAYFSSRAGGLVCRGCAAQVSEKRRISSELLGADRQSAPPAMWFDLLDYHLTHLASKRMRTAKQLADAFTRGRATRQTAARQELRPPAGDAPSP